MTTNSQLLTTTPKTNKNKTTKQTTTTRVESQKWRSHGGLSVGKWEGETAGKDTENKQHKWQVENRQGEVKNNTGNEAAKELICMTYGHELKGGNAGRMWHAGLRGIKGEKSDNCNSIINKIYFLKSFSEIFIQL